MTRFTVSLTRCLGMPSGQRRAALLLAAAVGASACATDDTPLRGGNATGPAANRDVQDALARLPAATVLLTDADGVPQYIVGELGRVDATRVDDALAADQRVRPALAPVLAAFRLTTDEVALRTIVADEQGGRHLRYTQLHQGVEVVGADLAVHLDASGRIVGANGTARGGLPAALGANPISTTVATARIAADPRFAGLAITHVREIFVQDAEGAVHAAYEQLAEGVRAGAPVRDEVYVDVTTGELAAVRPTIHELLSRRVYDAGHANSLPGTLARTEGQVATGEVDVDAAFDHSGMAYATYFYLFGRDSLDNQGRRLTSTVHYSSYYCNAFWNGNQMAYGDGDPARGCAPLARGLDVVGHEYTHGVTSFSSGLVYAGEPGGLNESMSDIFGAVVQAFGDGDHTGSLEINATTFLIGEAVLPPFIRDMCDPAADGKSADVWYSTIGSLNVHQSSGPNNLAFCLLTKGGTHPRGKTTTVVPAIGMDRAARIFYKANTEILTSGSKYGMMRVAAQQAARALGYAQDVVDAVGCAYAAVSVGVPPASCATSDILWRHEDGTLAAWFMNGGSKIGEAYPVYTNGQPPGTEWTLEATGDFDGDGQTDILWRHIDGSLAIWSLSRGALIRETYPTFHGAPVSSGWEVVGAGYFDGDATSDILWRHEDGDVAIWRMTNGVLAAETYPAPAKGPDWQVQAIADFNRDGWSDVLWRRTDGSLDIWFVTGHGDVYATHTAGQPGNDWVVAGTGDFDRDGYADLLWRNLDGSVAIWFMNGSDVRAMASPGWLDPAWRVERPGDFDGDGKTDILWRHANGTLYIWFMDGGTTVSQASPGSVAQEWRVEGVANLD